MKIKQSIYKSKFLGAVFVLLLCVVAVLIYVFKPDLAINGTDKQQEKTTMLNDASGMSPSVLETDLQSVEVADSQHEDKLAQQTSKLELLGENLDYMTAEQRFTEVFARRENAFFTEAELREAMKKSNMWETDGVDKEAIIVEHNLTEEDINDGRVFINYDPLKVESLVSGDTLKIDIPQDKAYEMQVNNVVVNDPQTVSWHGELLGTEAEARTSVSITQSERITQIGIFTPDNFYVAEIFDGKGWVVPGGALIKGGEVVVPVDENGVEQEPEIYTKEPKSKNHNHDNHGHDHQH